MARVGIVTDSTADLPLEEYERLGVEMVSLTVLFGEEALLDWRDIHPEEFYKRLTTAPALPTTSQPSPADFSAVYARLAEQGCDHIVSIHLSAALSGTWQSASIAAETSPVPVTVIDTKKLTQALALVVKAAVEERDKGADGPAVASRAQAVADSMRLLFVLDTLEFLVKGGRAGKAQGLAATLLNIKPVLQVNADGIIEPFKKVKGRRKAISELVAHVMEEAAVHGRMRASVFHACGANNGQELLDELRATGAAVDVVSVDLVGAVVGTYAGPEAIGIAYYPID